MDDKPRHFNTTPTDKQKNNSMTSSPWNNINPNDIQQQQQQQQPASSSSSSSSSSSASYWMDSNQFSRGLKSQPSQTFLTNNNNANLNSNPSATIATGGSQPPIVNLSQPPNVIPGNFQLGMMPTTSQRKLASANQQQSIQLTPPGSSSSAVSTSSSGSSTNASSMGSVGALPPNPNMPGGMIGGPPSSLDEDLIPTAIVIKNIPFAIKKEQLLEVMTNLRLPIPYAFNYHFDNGVFRGLAFANFTTPEDTSAVINNLNGREIGGRKLRVEYKKMLPLAERERIEREKREKRGQLEEQHRGPNAPTNNKNIRHQHNHHHHNHNNHQQHHNNANNHSNANLPSAQQLVSLQPNQQQQLVQSANQQQQQQATASVTANSPGPTNSSAAAQQGHANNLFSQQGGPQSSRAFIGNALNSTHSSPGASHNASATTPNSRNANTATVVPHSPSSSSIAGNNMSVDLNDPDNLGFYSKILLFRDDRSRNQLVFPASLTPQQKNNIMILCKTLGVVYNVQDNGALAVTRLSNNNGGSTTNSVNTNTNGSNTMANYSQTPMRQQQHMASTLNQQPQQPPLQGMFDGPHPLQGSNHLNSMSATNLSSFVNQPSSIGLQHPQPQSPLNNMHTQPHNGLLFSQQGGSGSNQYSHAPPAGPPHNILRGTKSFADIRAPVNNFGSMVSSPGTPAGSPFFPSQTPPPQLSLQNQSNQQSQPQPNLSALHQQRGGYGHYNQPFVQQQQQQPQQNQQMMGHQPYMSSSHGLPYNLGNNNNFSNDYQISGFQQFGGGAFGGSTTSLTNPSGIGSLTDSFSNMLSIGGTSLSRAPSTSNITGSLTGPGSVGSSSPTASISSMQNIDGSAGNNNSNAVTTTTTTMTTNSRLSNSAPPTSGGSNTNSYNNNSSNTHSDDNKDDDFSSNNGSSSVGNAGVIGSKPTDVTNDSNEATQKND